MVNIKKGVIFIIIIAVLVILSIFIIKDITSNYKHYDIVIIHYEPGTLNIIKKIKIESKENIEQIDKYVKELKPLQDSEKVNLMLLDEIVIKYNEFITISMQLGQKEYCNYSDTERNIHYMSKMPTGLYEWVEGKI